MKKISIKLADKRFGEVIYTLNDVPSILSIDKIKEISKICSTFIIEKGEDLLEKTLKISRRF